MTKFKGLAKVLNQVLGVQPFIVIPEVILL